LAGFRGGRDDEGFLYDIAIQRNGKWAFLNWRKPRGVYLSEGDTLTINFYPDNQ